MPKNALIAEIQTSVVALYKKLEAVEKIMEKLAKEANPKYGEIQAPWTEAIQLHVQMNTAVGKLNAKIKTWENPSLKNILKNQKKLTEEREQAKTHFNNNVMPKVTEMNGEFERVVKLYNTLK
jgi:hypothetical protein